MSRELTEEELDYLQDQEVCEACKHLLMIHFFDKPSGKELCWATDCKCKDGELPQKK